MLSFSKLAVLAAMALGAYAVMRMVRVATRNNARRVDAKAKQAETTEGPVQLEACPRCGAYAQLKQHRCET